MKVTLSTIGRFHIFPLAKELEKYGYLQAIYSGFPWSKLQREGISKQYVHTYPWVRPLLMATRFLPFRLSESQMDALHQLSVVTLDKYVAKHLPQSNIYVGHEAVGLISGSAAKKRGIKYVCDRGCSHMAWRERILQEENERLGLPPRRRPNTYAREIAEYELADLIVVPSQFVADSFIAEGISKEKLAIVPYGVNLQKFHPVAKPSSEYFDIVFVGRIGARKGVKDLLDAFNQANINNKRLTLVGTIDADFEQRFATELKQPNIIIKGHVAQIELKHILSQSHVFCLPSIEDGFGMAVAEAMACGCPAIVTYNAGANMIVKANENGFVVPIREPKILAEKLEYMANHPKERNLMAEKALNSVKNLGGWESYGRNMIEVYSSLLNNCSCL